MPSWSSGSYEREQKLRDPVLGPTGIDRRPHDHPGVLRSPEIPQRAARNLKLDPADGAQGCQRLNDCSHRSSMIAGAGKAAREIDRGNTILVKLQAQQPGA